MIRTQEVKEEVSFDDRVSYMVNLGELLMMLEDSSVPNKYGLQVKICNEIEAIIDSISIRND